MAFSSCTKMPTLERNPLTATLMAASVSGDSEIPREIFFQCIKVAKISSKQLCNSEVALRQLLRCNLTLKSHRSSGNRVWSRILKTYLQVKTRPCRLSQESMNYVQYQKNSTFRGSLEATSLETEDNTHFICLPPKGEQQNTE